MKKITDLPVYDQIDDLVLIGTSHLLDCRRDLEKTRVFLGHILKADHLFLEGYERQYLLSPNQFNYEMLAYHKRPESTRFIEEGEDFLEKGGIRKDLFGLYMTINLMWNVIRKVKDTEDRARIIPEIIKKLDDKYPAIKKEKTLEQFIEVTGKHGISADLFMLSAQWCNYASRNRDQYIFGPKSKKWKKTLQGTKVELVGYNHFIFLQKYLRGEEVMQPAHWHDTLNKGCRELAKDIEKNMFSI